uniref:Slow anion channel-associated 1a n=1 Tax=Ginkgo biloba TaxID=3311 RepID=A0A977J4X2_GINBI|nr:slow anion channel-associated 1a [Ginkgo biloba]
MDTKIEKYNALTISLQPTSSLDRVVISHGRSRSDCTQFGLVSETEQKTDYGINHEFQYRPSMSNCDDNSKQMPNGDSVSLMDKTNKTCPMELGSSYDDSTQKPCIDHAEVLSDGTKMSRGCNTFRPVLENESNSRVNSPRGAVLFEGLIKENVPAEKGKAKINAVDSLKASSGGTNIMNDQRSPNLGNWKQKLNKPWGSKLTRQVSLGTGYAVVNKGNAQRPTVLPRSGASFGGFSNSRGMTSKENYSLFRTKSGLDKQNSLVQGRVVEEMERQEYAASGCQQSVNAVLPAGRYFDALKGPELDVLRDSEDILLPLDQKWPFLLRFPIGCFGICLGLSSQAILWKTLAKTPSMEFLHVPTEINLALWFLALCALIVIFFTYSLKCMFYFEAVRREYYHPVRINFFFAPWIVCMFLTIGVPSAIAESIHPSLWCTFMAPVFALELKIYGQWLSGGKRRLSKVANPSSHLSVVGNFVGALLAALVGWKEPAKFFWAVGLAHYMVLFVTLYQRLPTSEALPKELHPVFFLFIAAPCTASVAWEAIYDEFDGVSRTGYFVALFLYTSLVVRINLFRGFRFSVAWWAYTFPMTAASVATVRYSNTVTSPATQGLALILSLISSTTVFTLFVTTLLHAFVWDSLFPNDLAIAITHRRNKPKVLKETKKKTSKFDFEQRTAPIRRSMDILRGSFTKQTR